MNPPAILIRIAFESAPRVYVDCESAGGESRLYDWLTAHPEYAEYRQRVPMIVPGMPRRVEMPPPARRASI